MRSRFPLSPLLCWALLLIPLLARAETPPSAADGTARVIVKYKLESPLLRKRALSLDARQAVQAQELGARVGLELRSGAPLAERMQVLLGRGLTSEQLARRLSAENDIEYAVADERRDHFVAPNDPLYQTGSPLTATAGGPVAGQWYLRAPDGEVQSSVDTEPAWALVDGASPIVIALIDTGVRFDHEDLKPVTAGGNLLPGYDMISDPNIANDGDGRDADPSDPGDWLTLSEIQDRTSPFFGCGSAARDSSWHGTKTGGLIGALTNNRIGMASVGRSIRILPVRVLGKCGGYDSDVIAGMRWAAGLGVPGVPANLNPARVLNLSLGGDAPCNAAYQDAVTAINAVGAVVVAAAGNSAGHAVGTPANCLGVIAVAGLRHVGTKVGFSNLGPNVTVSAPAGNCVNTAAATPCLYPILTTANAGLTTPIADAAGGSIYTDSYRSTLGTSFSAPLVAGAAALMLSLQPSLRPVDVRRILQVSARPFPTTGGDNGDGTTVPQCTLPQPIAAIQFDQLQCYCTTLTCGAGMLDIGAAVLAARTQLFELSVTRSGRGKVTSTPTGISCGSDCDEGFISGTAVTLTATADANAPGGDYVFSGWGGACAAFGPQSACTVRMSAAQEASAVFDYVGDGTTYSRTAVEKAYVAYYGRPADPVGLSYWAVRMDAEGQSLEAIIGAFGTSTESNQRYAGLSDSALITQIYEQVLARDPDAAGLAYYVAELQAGRRSRQSIAIDVLNGANKGRDLQVVADKVDVAFYYSVKVANGCPYGATANAVNILASVTDALATVAAAKNAIDSRCGA